MIRISYSGLSTYKQCPMKYDFVYNKGCRSEEKTIALELGGFTHEILEDKINMQIEGNLNLMSLLDKFNKGLIEIEKTFQLEEYEEKIEIFRKRILKKEEFDGWKPVCSEMPFEFEFNGFMFNGFIDLVLEKDGEYKVKDYKSSKKEFDEKELPTNLQFFIYCLAIERKFGKPSIEHEFDFILLGTKQMALTRGFYNRGIKLLTKLTDELKNDTVFKPKPSPLCHWCHLSGNTCVPSEWFNGACHYYSLWHPDDKNYKVNKTWED